jgi:hypothetical protein
MNKRADFVMPSWLGKLIIALIAFGLIAVLIIVVIGPPAEQVVGSDIIYRLQTLSFGDRGVTGAIGDPATAVCFGTGAGKSVMCLNRNNGNELFNARLLMKDGYAMSKPVLVSDGIILGFGKFVCKYDQTGSEQWCQTFKDPVTSGIAVDNPSDANVTCFETGKFPDVNGQMTCLDAKTGEFKFSVSSTEKMASTPSIDQSKNVVYFAAGAYVYMYELDSQGILQAPTNKVLATNMWNTKKYDHAIVSDIALGEGLVCFDSSPKMHCVNESTSVDSFDVYAKTGVRGGQDCPDDDSQRTVSTPMIYNGSIYFGICSSIIKCNVTNTTGENINSDCEEWVFGGPLAQYGQGYFSKPIYAGVTIGIVSPIPGATFNYTTIVCTGSGENQKVACFFDEGNSSSPFVSMEGDWGDCPRATTKLALTRAQYDSYFNVGLGARTCFADSTPILSKDIVYYALGNRVCATNLTSLKKTGELILNETTSTTEGGIAKWCESEGASDIFVTGSHTWVPSVTDLAIYEPPPKFVAGTPGVVG